MPARCPTAPRARAAKCPTPARSTATGARRRFRPRPGRCISVRHSRPCLYFLYHVKDSRHDFSCYRNGMEFEWDQAKRAANLAKHGLDFVEVARFDWEAAIIIADLRFDYGEDRFQAFALLDGFLHQVTFTRRGHAIRIVSFRHANRKERRLYGP